MKRLLLTTTLFLAVTTAAAQEKTAVPEPPTPVTETPPKPDERMPEVDEPAEFPGGQKALLQFLAHNLMYPQRAIEESLQGKCFVRFLVAADGSISNITVARGIFKCPECDKEAVRVVSIMPEWIPGKTDGKAVDSYFYLPITFKLQ
jgi:protein TonB